MTLLWASACARLRGSSACKNKPQLPQKFAPSSNGALHFVHLDGTSSALLLKSFIARLMMCVHGSCRGSEGGAPSKAARAKRATEFEADCLFFTRMRQNLCQEEAASRPKQRRRKPSGPSQLFLQDPTWTLRP